MHGSLSALGFIAVHEEERAVLESFGKYKRTKKPGLGWVCPGLRSVRAVIKISQQTIPLLDDPQHPNVIDFLDASAKVVGAAAFVRVKSPDTPYDPGDGNQQTGVYRAIYGHVNWRAAVKDIVGNAVRSYLNNLPSIDDALGIAGGYNLIRLGPKGIPDEEILGLQETLALIGIELLQVTIQDFETSAAFQQSRESRSRSQAEVEALTSRTVGIVVAMKANAKGKKIEEMQLEIANDPKLQKEVFDEAKDLLVRQMAIEGKAYTDIRTSGGGSLENSLASLISLWKSK